MWIVHVHIVIYFQNATKKSDKMQSCSLLYVNVSGAKEDVWILWI